MAREWRYRFQRQLRPWSLRKLNAFHNLSPSVSFAVILIYKICPNSSLLECSPPTTEAWVRFLARRCQPRVRMEVTLVKSLHSDDPEAICLARTCKCLMLIFRVEQLASAILPHPSVFMHVHVTHALEGALLRAHVDFPKS